VSRRSPPSPSVTGGGGRSFGETRKLPAALSPDSRSLKAGGRSCRAGSLEGYGIARSVEGGLEGSCGRLGWAAGVDAAAEAAETAGAAAGAGGCGVVAGGQASSVRTARDGPRTGAAARAENRPAASAYGESRPAAAASRAEGGGGGVSRGSGVLFFAQSTRREPLRARRKAQRPAEAPPAPPPARRAPYPRTGAIDPTRSSTGAGTRAPARSFSPRAGAASRRRLRGVRAALAVAPPDPGKGVG
jgi:hypothetical protein